MRRDSLGLPAERPLVPSGPGHTVEGEMINRLQGYFAEARPPPDLYVVSVLRDDFVVTGAEAARVMEELTTWGLAWIRFTDLYGSTVNARSEYISVVRECAPQEREAALELLEPLEQEPAADPDGDDDGQDPGPGPGS